MFSYEANKSVFNRNDAMINNIDISFHLFLLICYVYQKLNAINSSLNEKKHLRWYGRSLCVFEKIKLFLSSQPPFQLDGAHVIEF